MGPSGRGMQSAYFSAQAGGMKTQGGSSGNSRPTERSADNFDKHADDMKYNMGDEEWAPVVLPLEDEAITAATAAAADSKPTSAVKPEGRSAAKGKTKRVRVVGEEEDAAASPEEDVKVKQELGELSASFAAAQLIPSFETDPQMPATALDKLYLLQFPPVLPKFDMDSLPTMRRDPMTGELVLSNEDEEEAEAAGDAGVEDKKPAAAASKGNTDTATKVAEGCIGKLQVYRSGRMKLQMGEVCMDVSSLSNTSFLQQVVAVDVQHAQSFVMGQVAGKFALALLSLLAASVNADIVAQDVSAAMVTLVNAVRALNGVASYTVNSDLTASCQEHAKDMATRNFMDHTGSDGSTPVDRAHRHGYTSSFISENIAFGQTTIQQVMADWVKSPGHFANLIRADSTEMGAAVATSASGVKYWSQCFGSRNPRVAGPQPASPPPAAPAPEAAPRPVVKAVAAPKPAPRPVFVKLVEAPPPPPPATTTTTMARSTTTTTTTTTTLAAAATTTDPSTYTTTAPTPAPTRRPRRCHRRKHRAHVSHA
ncbi:hypothetical protein RI367_007683 [Sorochytrium milnesiophthora]